MTTPTRKTSKTSKTSKTTKASKATRTTKTTKARTTTGRAPARTDKAPARPSPASEVDRRASGTDATRGRTHSQSFYDEAKRHAARSDDANAFVGDPAERGALVVDDLAEELAENFLTSATSGADAASEAMDDVAPEEVGGPFVQTSARREFASGTDASNPPDAEPEAFPTTMQPVERTAR